MTVYKVKPGVGLGPIKLDMTPEQVREVMHVEPDTIYLYEGSGIEKQFYYPDFLISFSEKYRKIEHISVGRSDDIRTIYKNINIFTTKIGDVIELVSQEAKLDEDYQEKAYLFVFPELELCFARPIIPEDFDEDFKILASEKNNYSQNEYNHRMMILEEEYRKSHFFETVTIGCKGYYNKSTAFSGVNVYVP